MCVCVAVLMKKTVGNCSLCPSKEGEGGEGGAGVKGNKTQVSRNKIKIKCRHAPQANFHVLIVLRLMLCARSRLVRPL